MTEKDYCKCLEDIKNIHGNNINMDFKSINGFGHYLINKDGLIFNSRTGTLRKGVLDKKGYCRVRLTDGKMMSVKKVHRLVAEAFLDDYSDDLQVNHKNCIKCDNRLCNLEMVTQSQNTKHAWVNKRMKLTKRDKDGKFTKL